MSCSLLKMNRWQIYTEAGCGVSHDTSANNFFVWLGYALKVGWQVQFIHELVPATRTCRRPLLNVA
jgi:hypothetical protein